MMSDGDAHIEHPQPNVNPDMQEADEAAPPPWLVHFAQELRQNMRQDFGARFDAMEERLASVQGNIQRVDTFVTDTVAPRSQAAFQRVEAVEKSLKDNLVPKLGEVLQQHQTLGKKLSQGVVPELKATAHRLSDLEARYLVDGLEGGHNRALQGAAVNAAIPLDQDTESSEEVKFQGEKPGLCHRPQATKARMTLPRTSSKQASQTQDLQQCWNLHLPM